jgi:para-aminobenzoate synthetase/4-amino-4-deoxychorismate lyase
MRTAVFESSGRRPRGWRASFNQPRAVHVAHTPAEVSPLVTLADEAARAGRWVAVMLTYEAAAFDPAIRTHTLTSLPLAWAAEFDDLASFPDLTSPAAYEIPAWQPLITKADFAAAIAQIHERIAAGDTYQVNYTFPLASRFRGDAWSWFVDLKSAQQADYCAYLDTGRYLILSLSPELFFERRGNRLTTRPMKGTAARGRFLEEDDERAARLQSSAKERAENLMIVDLLRNDLGRVAVTGSVRVPQLFAVERYPTVLQMTSTIEAECRSDARLLDILKALFPCGSITGAPKLRTMEIIRALEPHPRGVYTGAIGLIEPGGDCLFNVAIRTLVLDKQSNEVRFGVGGGITIDSTAEAEYDECALKAAFLSHRPHSFQLLETLLLEGGEYYLLERHLERVTASARYFGFACDTVAMRAALDRVRLTHMDGHWKVRLLCSDDGVISATADAVEIDAEKTYRVAFARRPTDSRNAMLFHKTTDRRAYEDELRRRADVDDLLFWNERGEVTESSIANVVLITEDRKWTPPRASGLLRGVLAAELINTGELCERVITKEELTEARSFYLINSVRKWMRAVLVA